MDFSFCGSQQNGLCRKSANLMCQADVMAGISGARLIRDGLIVNYSKKLNSSYVEQRFSNSLLGQSSINSKPLALFDTAAFLDVGGSMGEE